MIKEFNLSIGIIISLFDALFGGCIGGCVGGIINIDLVAVILGICFGLVMLVLDFKYSFDEL
jgi:hypothetical protein